MSSKNAKPDFDEYFKDPALVKAFYIPTEFLKLDKNRKEVGCLLVFLLVSVPQCKFKFRLIRCVSIRYE